MAETTSSSGFPRVERKARGYAPSEVDEFLGRAREAFERGTASMTSAEIRGASFSFERGGYEIASVDGALARLEDVFSERERREAIAQTGVEEWVAEARATAQVLLARLSRAPGERFRRAGVLAWGYRVDDVDRLADELVAFFQSGGPISVERIRNAAFRMSRRGYEEAQVDAVMDATIEVLLAVRPSS